MRDDEPLRFSADDPRLRRLNDAPEDPRGEYVLYWSQIFRRGRDNAALAWAVARANALRLPVLFYESIRPDAPYASDRTHRFVLECARDTAAACAERGIAHAFFLPRTADEARGVVAKLAARAALVVTDDSPAFLVPAQNEAAARRVRCAFVAVDDCVGVPLALFPRDEVAARTLRPKVLRARDAWLRPLDDPDPTVAAPPRLELPFAPVDLARGDLAALVASCAIDHGVPAVDETRGGAIAAEERLARFVARRLAAYAEERNDPTRDATSGLSPYLHFGAISARRVALAAREAARDRGVDDASLEAFLEQLLVRRGLAYVFARRNPHPTSWRAIPEWARRTLDEHARDPRPAIVDRDALEAAESPDPLWNAAQRELRARGTIQGYARMLWGKLVIGWTKSPSDAHALLVAMNDRWALDGRDPDGWANIGWCFGLHDRPWPERPIFGKVRAMTSRSARAKLDFDAYVDRARAWRVG